MPAARCRLVKKKQRPRCLRRRQDLRCYCLLCLNLPALPILLILVMGASRNASRNAVTGAASVKIVIADVSVEADAVKAETMETRM